MVKSFGRTFLPIGVLMVSTWEARNQNGGVSSRSSMLPVRMGT
jgi:hypothetical protein